MLTLHELQTTFARSLVGEGSRVILDMIEPDGLDAAVRLSVYRNNISARLTDTLRAAYPVVCSLVDERFFDYAAATFLRTQPPTEACLAEYGAGFADFLESFEAADSLQYLPDVARLEWCVHRVYRAAEPQPLSIDALERWQGDPSGVRLRLAPGLAYVSAPYAVDRIWVAHQNLETLHALTLDEIDVFLEVSGRGGGVTMGRLDPANWLLRSQLAGSATLGHAVARAMAVGDFDPAAALASLFAEGCVVGIDTRSLARDCE